MSKTYNLTQLLKVFLHDAVEIIQRKKVLKERIFFLNFSHSEEKIDKTLREISGRGGFKERKKNFRLDYADSIEESKILETEMYNYCENIILYCMFRPGLRYISSHAFSNTAYDACASSWNFITFLKNPIDRILSCYIDKIETQSIPKNIDIHSFVDSSYVQEMGSDYVFNLLGNDQKSLNKSAIQMAKANIKKFDIVGISDDLSGFIKKMETKFSVTLNIELERSNNISKIKNQLSDDTLGKIEKICQPNLEIFNYVKTTTI